MKKLFLVMAMVFFHHIAFAAGFGGVEWGSTPEEFQNKIGFIPQNKSAIEVKEKYSLWGHDWSFAAFTDETGFSKVILFTMENDFSEISRLKDKVQEALIKKYGEPIVKEEKDDILSSFLINQRWIGEKTIAEFSGSGAKKGKGETGSGMLTVRFLSRIPVDGDKF